MVGICNDFRVVYVGVKLPGPAVHAPVAGSGEATIAIKLGFPAGRYASELAAQLEQTGRAWEAWARSFAILPRAPTKKSAGETHA